MMFHVTQDDELLFFFLTADEVPAAATEVSGVSGGWQGPGGSAGPQSRAYAPQV